MHHRTVRSKATGALLASALAAVLLAAAAAPLGATLQPQADPVILDGALDCGTGDPAIAALAGGGFVVAWSDGVRLSTRRLDAAGQPVAPATVVAQGDPSEPEAVALSTGGYALVWWDRTRRRVLARFFDAGGAGGPEVEVGTAGPDPGTGFGGLDAAADADGTLAVVWTDHQSVYLRELRPDGGALTPPWQVNEGYWQVFQEAIADFSPAVIVAADGTLRVFWVEGYFTPTIQRDGTVQGRTLVRDAAAGYRRTEWIITGADGHDPEAAMAADGSYLLAWVGTETYYLDPPPPVSEFPAVLSQAFDAADIPRGPLQLLDGTALVPAAGVAVAAAPDGGFVVAWETDLPTGVDGVTTALARASTRAARREAMRRAASPRTRRSGSRGPISRSARTGFSSPPGRSSTTPTSSSSSAPASTCGRARSVSAAARTPSACATAASR